MDTIRDKLAVIVELEAEDGYFLTDPAQQHCAGDNLLRPGTCRAPDADHHIHRDRRQNITAAVIEVRVYDILAGRRAAAVAHLIIQIAGIAQVATVIAQQIKCAAILV